jgi:hypothetical protein
MMSDLWIETANKVINAWRTEWDRYPFGSRANDKVVKAIVDKHKLPEAFVEEAIYLHEYGYIDSDDVDLGERLAIDNPEWEHKPDAFLMFRAIHQLWSYNNCLTFENPRRYDV